MCVLITNTTHACGVSFAEWNLRNASAVYVRNQFGSAEMPIIASARIGADPNLLERALKAQNISGAPAINDCIYLPAAAFKFKRRGEEKDAGWLLCVCARALNAKQRKDSRNVAADYIIHKDITLSLVRFRIPRRARKPLLFSPRSGIICIFTTPFLCAHSPPSSGCVDFFRRRQRRNTKNNLHRQPCRPRLYSKCLKLNTQTHSAANKRALRVLCASERARRCSPLSVQIKFNQWKGKWSLKLFH